MDEDNTNKMKSEITREQAWMDLKQYTDDITRIALDGPSSERDAMVMQKALLILAGELQYRKAQRLRDEKQLKGLFDEDATDATD